MQSLLFKIWKVKTYDHLSLRHSHLIGRNDGFRLVQSCMNLQNSVGTLEVKLGFKIQTLGALAQPFNIKNSLMYKNVKVWQWQHMKSCDWESPRERAMVPVHPPTHTLAWKQKLMQTIATKKRRHERSPLHQSQTSIYSEHSVTKSTASSGNSKADFLLTMDQHK